MKVKVICVFITLAGFQIVSAQARYNIRLLDTPSGTHSSYVEAINNNGEAAGSAYTASADRAMKWSSATTPVVTNLGNLGTWGISRAYDINDSGDICGVGQLSSSDPYQPLLWSGGSMANIIPSGGYAGYAYGINSHGHVAGMAYAGPGYTNQHPFVWNGTSSSNIVPGGGYNTDQVVGINDAGHVIASNYGSATVAIYANGSRNVIANNGWWSNPIVLAINHLGQALYVQSTGGPSYSDYLSLWNPNVRNTTTGFVQDITPTGRATGYTLGYKGGLNAYGDACFSYTPTGSTSPIAVVRLRTSTGASVWENLNTLIPAGSGWVLWSAKGINDKGQIVGEGQYTVSGVTRWCAFRLDPIGNVMR